MRRLHPTLQHLGSALALSGLQSPAHTLEASQQVIAEPIHVGEPDGVPGSPWPSPSYHRHLRSEPTNRDIFFSQINKTDNSPGPHHVSPCCPASKANKGGSPPTGVTSEVRSWHLGSRQERKAHSGLEGRGSCACCLLCRFLGQPHPLPSPARHLTHSQGRFQLVSHSSA